MISGLRITGKDDFMRPEKDCIVMKNYTPKPMILEPVKILVNDDGSFNEIKQGGGKSEPLQPTKISLTDCLACSGCVTTSETILIEAQGLSNLLTHINSDKTVVVSICAQSRASLGAYFGLSHELIFGKLITLFHRLGVKFVFDVGFAEEICLLETAMEFLEKKKKVLEGETFMPLLTSMCPGWICYAEKNHGDLLKYISTTKSPQQIMGCLIKTQFAEKIQTHPKDIYHVSIMPCYDKKLEASRDDFYHQDTESHEVDCVLATSEILQLIKNQNFDFLTLPGTPLKNSHFMNLDEFGHLCGMSGGTSGGYLEFVYRHAAKDMWNVDVDKIEYKQGRNPDFVEASLVVDGKTVLRFARANGFRNIQNIVRRLKQQQKTNVEESTSYDFIEVMACPGGCTNGGGQIRTESNNTQESKNLLIQVNEIYNETTKNCRPFGTVNPMVVAMFKDLWKDPSMRLKYLHTTYHAVPKQDLNPLAIKW